MRQEEDMPIRTGPRRHFPLALALTWGLLAGCGGGDSGELPTVRVSGTLSVDGKPVSKGTVHFVPANGRPATGIVEDGKFTLSTYKEGDGVVAGQNRISVEVVQEVPTKDGDTTAKSLIPAKFTNPDTSGLQLDVRPGGYSNLQINIAAGMGSIKED
jgi:hypothetical protein